MEHGGGHNLSEFHTVQYIGGLAFNMDTLYMTWLSMGIVLAIAFLATRGLRLVPGGVQNVLEIIFEALHKQIDEVIGPKGKFIAPLLVTLFMFLLISNELGLIPGFTSPTNDINTTLGLALFIVLLVHVLSIKNKGFVNWVKHFFQPWIPFVVINVLEELSKPITLSFRLFGNILAGEILLIVLGMLVPYILPVAWLGFSVFVGVIQAFIFTMLSLSYLSMALKDEQH